MVPGMITTFPAYWATGHTSAEIKGMVIFRPSPFLEPVLTLVFISALGTPVAQYARNVLICISVYCSYTVTDFSSVILTFKFFYHLSPIIYWIFSDAFLSFTDSAFLSVLHCFFFNFLFASTICK